MVQAATLRSAWRFRELLPMSLAAVLGVAAGILPMPGGVVAVGVAAALVLIAIEPAAGLGLTFLAAPLRARLSVIYPSFPVDPGQVLLLVTFAAWLARGLARQQIRAPRLPAALSLGLGFFLIVGAFSLWAAASPGEGLVELAKWAQVGLVALLVKDAADRGRLGWVLTGLLTTGLLQAALGLWQFAFSTNSPASFAILGDRFRAYGTFEQPNPYGGFLGLLWPVAAGFLLYVFPPAMDAGRRALGLVTGGLAVGLLILGLLLSFSRGAWLGAVASGLTMAAFLPRRPWLGLALVLLAVLVAAVAMSAGWIPAAAVARLDGIGEFVAPVDVRGTAISVENYAVIQRLAFWQTARAMADAHPWLGVGLGNYAAAYPAFALMNWPLPIGHAHNIYLNVLAETGVLGLAAYGAFWAVAGALTLAALRRGRGWRRGLGLGLLGAWVHLAVHQIVDFLYVNNLHLVVGAYLGVLAYLVLSPEEASAVPRMVEGRPSRNEATA